MMMKWSESRLPCYANWINIKIASSVLINPILLLAEISATGRKISAAMLGLSLLESVICCVNQSCTDIGKLFLYENQTSSTRFSMLHLACAAQTTSFPGTIRIVPLSSGKSGTNTEIVSPKTMSNCFAPKIMQVVPLSFLYRNMIEMLNMRGCFITADDILSHEVSSEIFEL